MDKDTIIVPVSKFSFQKAYKERIYAFPSSYNRDQSKKYIAFYQTMPVKAITHYAKIESVETRSIKNFPIKDALLMFGHRFDDEIIVFNLCPLIKLEKQITAKKMGIQGCRYSCLETLLEANDLGDI